jgi:hypothetical protein
MIKNVYPEAWVAIVLIAACIVLALALAGCQVPLRNY